MHTEWPGSIPLVPTPILALPHLNQAAVHSRMNSVVCRPRIILLEILQVVPIFNCVYTNLYRSVRDIEAREQVGAVISKLIVGLIAVSPIWPTGLGVLPQSIPSRIQEIFSERLASVHCHNIKSRGLVSLPSTIS